MKARYQISFLVFCIFITCFSCSVRESENNSILGSWKSIGYGRVMVVDTSGYQLYDITSISCLPSDTGSLTDLKVVTTLEQDTLSINIGYDIYRYERLEETPSLCDVKLSDEMSMNPEFNFEVFAATYKENYYYFSLNNIDWDSLYVAYREQVDESTTGVQLYTIMQELLNELKDNHGSVYPDDETYDLYEAAQTSVSELGGGNDLPTYGDFTVADRVTDYYLSEEMTRDSWLIKWGKMENNVGYIQVKTMFLYGELELDDERVKEIGIVDAYREKLNELSYFEQFSVEIEGVNNILDNVMSDLDSTEFIILDTRFNGGGSDEVGLEILRRFNSQRLKIASKRARNYDGYSPTIPLFLEGSKDAYRRPVYLLTSQQSASATDFLAMATMAMDNVTRIGSRTNGALSDALEKRLPNGWYFSLSNESYLNIQKMNFESKGIPVDYELNYPADRQTFFRLVVDDLEADRTKVLKAINDLQRN